MYIDAHCHLDLPAFDEDRSAVLERARAAGVSRFLVAGVGPDGWKKQRALAQLEAGVSWAAGLHPVYCAELSRAERRQALQDLPTCFEGPAAAIAVGETGLDRVFAHADTLATQIESLRTHLELAKALEIPIILHVVGAHGACIDILRKDGVPERGGMVHSFSGSAEVAQEYLRQGLHLSVSGAVGRLRSERALRGVRAIPDERLLLETDAPDQAMEKGQRSEPADLILVAERVAKVRGCTSEEILRHSAANYARLFGEYAEGSNR